MLTTPKAIQTRYKGFRFRSRLEARYAVFFDASGIEWQYEPEGYDLSSYQEWYDDQTLGRYLPDFWLPKFKNWVEIKGSIPSPHFLTTHEETRMLALCQHTDVQFGYVFYGMPDAPSLISTICNDDGVSRSDEGISVFCTPRNDVEKGVIAARSARFEFGESGAR